MILYQHQRSRRQRLRATCWGWTLSQWRGNFGRWTWVSRWWGRLHCRTERRGGTTPGQKLKELDEQTALDETLQDGCPSACVTYPKRSWEFKHGGHNIGIWLEKPKWQRCRVGAREFRTNNTDETSFAPTSAFSAAGMLLLRFSWFHRRRSCFWRFCLWKFPSGYVSCVKGMEPTGGYSNVFLVNAMRLHTYGDEFCHWLILLGFHQCGAPLPARSSAAPTTLCPAVRYSSTIMSLLWHAARKRTWR